MLTAIIAAVVAANAPALPIVVGGTQGAIADRMVLASALREPIRATRPGETRYCVRDAISDPATERRVCRTRSAWRSLGLDPI